MKYNKKNILKSLAKIIISAGALYFVYTKIDLSEIKNIWKNINMFYIILAIGCFVLSKLISAYRLNHFFKAINLQLSTIQNLKLYLLGMLYNNFLPGGVGGDGYKVYLLNKQFKIKLKKIFLAVFSDRVAGMMILIFLASLLALYFQQFMPFNIGVFVLILLAIFTFFIITKKYIANFRNIIPIVLFQSFLVQLFQAICIIFLLLSFGEETNYLAYILIFLVSSIVIIIPISIGGLGLRELTFLLGVKYFNIQQALAINLSFTFYLITLFVSLWGIVFIYKPIFSKQIEKTE